MGRAQSERTSYFDIIACDNFAPDCIVMKDDLVSVCCKIHELLPLFPHFAGLYTTQMWKLWIDNDSH